MTGVQTCALPISTVTANPTTGTYGSPTTFTIAVTSGDATIVNGTVSLSDGTAGIGACTLTSGRCDVTTATLATGDHDLVATYATDGDFAASASATLTQTIVRNATTVVLASSVAPSVFGETVRLRATVTSTTGVPTGTIAFLDAGATIGACTLAGGVCDLTTATLAVGSHPLTATYAGDAN